MAQFARQAWTCRQLVALIWFACGIVLAPTLALAEIVIDDFVDDLRIDLPDDNFDRFLSQNIGDLAATRAISAGGSQTLPNGFLDVDQSVASALTVQWPNTTHTGSEPAASILMSYGIAAPFEGVDLSQDGLNQSVILEFNRLTADVPLNLIYVLATDGQASSSYISTFSPIPQSSARFHLVFPFDTFELARGAPVPNFDFSFIRELHVLVRLALFDPTFPEQLDFEMELTRIRVGVVVPEPPTAIGVGLLSVVWCMVWRCNGLSVGERVNVLSRVSQLFSPMLANASHPGGSCVVFLRRTQPNSHRTSWN